MHGCRPWGELGDILGIKLNRLEHVTTPVNTEGGSWAWQGHTRHAALPQEYNKHRHQPLAPGQGQSLPSTSHMPCSLTTPVSFSLSAGHL